MQQSHLEWEDFEIEAKNFNNDLIGKYRISCIEHEDDNNDGNFDELWTAFFIRDHNNIDKGIIIDLLDRYAPYVYFGNYNKSKERNKDPWGYKDGELKEGEIYYPIDIRDIVRIYVKELNTFENFNYYHNYRVAVGKKDFKQGVFDKEFYLKDANVIEENSNKGINIAYYNDEGFEYGITRPWDSVDEEYSLLEFEGTTDEPYVAAIDTNLSYPKGTSNFDDLRNNSKIYGTAYEYNGYIFLQYFFYYPFDPKTGKSIINKWFSRHSGDRERFVVILEKDNNDILKSTPVGAYFFHHLSDQVFAFYEENNPSNNDNEKFHWNDEKMSPGAYVKWKYVEKMNGHPHVYVAQGSHGIYFRQGSYTVTVDPSCWPEIKNALKEYAGGQDRKIYSIDKTGKGNVIYVPRLSAVDTKENNTEFSFLLFSGIAAQTENIELPCLKKPEKIQFPPYDDVWYAVDKYCFNGAIFEPKNNITEDLSKITIDPSVSIISPSDGANISSSVSVTTSASPLSNISKVEFYIDNVLKFTDSSDPYRWDWDTTKDTNGTHNLTAKAIALAGDDATSDIVSVTINNTSGNAPNIPTDLVQCKSDGVINIAVGGSTSERTVVMKGKVTDPDNNPVSLEVEIKPIGTSFAKLPSPNCVSGGSVSSGQIAAVTCSGLADGKYHWQARARDSNGAMSNWFSAGGNLESDADFIVSASLLKIGDWIKTSAEVNARETPGGTFIKEMPTGSSGQIKEGPQAAYYNGVLYTWWRIQWEDQEKTFGWSIQNPLVQIVNYQPAVTINSPNGNETLTVGKSYDIKWTATDNTGTIKKIDIFGSTDGGGNWSTIATNEVNDGSYSYIPSIATTKGRIRIEATDSFDGKDSDMSDRDFSVVSDCTAPSIPTLYSITPSTNSYYVNWSNSSNVSFYNLQEDDSSSFNSPSVVYTNSGTSWYSGEKLPGTYYYRVKAINNCGVSDWSNTQSVTIVGDQGPGDIVAINPANNATEQPLTVTLKWSANHPGGEGLRFNVYAMEGDNDIYMYADNNLRSYQQTETTYTLYNLPYNKVMSWAIVAIDDTGDTRYSPVFHFTTVGDSTVPAGSILINNGAESTTSYSVTLNLSASDSDSGVKHMRFSNDKTNWTYWEHYNSQYPWSLVDTRYGGKYGSTIYTVYAQFRDYEGNESQIYSDTITKVTGTPGQILLNGKVYETIQDAIDAASPGDTVYLTEGFYAIKGIVHPNNQKHPNTYFGIEMKHGITLMGAGANKTTISVEDTAGWSILDADNSTIEGLTIINSSSITWRYVILLESNSSKVKNCIIKGGTTGIYVGWNTTYSASNSEIINNLIIENSQPGIWINSGTDIHIYNNTIAANGDEGIFGWIGSAQIINNIITNNNIGVNSYDNSSIFKNNDIYGNSSANYNGKITDQTGINNNISVDPSFVNPTNKDYHLNTGSPCIDKGTNVGVFYNGIAPDMGAFEYNGTGTIQVISNRTDALFTIKGPLDTYEGSGTDWFKSDLPIGIYTITFSPITNLYSPSYQAKMLYSGQTLTFDGTYKEDTIGPTGIISVNFDEYATADKLVTVTLDLTDEVGGLGSSSQMMFSNDGVTWSTAEPYSAIKKDWDLTLYGGNTAREVKTVYAKVSDALGNWTSLTDTIFYVPDRNVLEVPTQYSTIQAAIDAAQDGDMVYVYPGDYGDYGVESITLKEGIRLQGAGPSVTVFNKSSCRIDMARNSMLDGFGDYMIVNCANGPAIVSNNWIKRGVSIGATKIIIRNNIISDNNFGIGIDGYTSSNIFIENNTFINLSDAVRLNNSVEDTKVYLKNNIIANNNIGVVESNALDTAHQHIFPSFNMYWNNTKGNFGELDPYYSKANYFKIMGPGDTDADPMFIDFPNNDFHLKAGSPAIDSGYPETRYNDPNSTRNDRGAYGGPSLNTPPMADFSVNPYQGGVGTIFIFDGNLSSDAESKSEQVKVRWDLDSDNIFDTIFSVNRKIVHRYDSLGNYNVTLQVMDKNGFISSVTKTVSVFNQSPNVPTNPTPADGAIDQPVDVILRWSGGDPDINDTVSYDVYFGTTSDPPLISSDQPDTFYIPGLLSSYTTYYWKIISKDSNGSTSIGPLWQFVSAYIDSIPPIGSISINDGAMYVNSTLVTLNLYATDNVGITDYYISTGSAKPLPSDSGWISVAPTSNYSSEISYTLEEGDGEKIVYVWYKDAAGNVSATESNSITLDTTAPTIKLTNPYNNEKDVAVDTIITVTFHEEMDTSAIVQAFTISDGSNNISGEVSCSGATAQFTPLTSLAYDKNYTATVTTGAKDLSGNNMAEDYSWRFTTPDITPPTVISTSPANNTMDVAIDTVITATFSEKIDPSTITRTTFTVSDGNNIDGDVSYDVNTITATFKPSPENLASGKTYIATITTDVKDLSGNTIAFPYTWSFKTETSWKTMPVEAPKWFSYFSSRTIALDTDNHPHIAYGGDRLCYVHHDGTGWHSEIVDMSPGVGYYASLAIDASGKVHISYRDRINHTIKYATNASGSWKIATVDSSGDVGLYTSIAIDTFGNAHVSYYDLDNGDLKYATNASGLWMAYPIDSTGDVGQYTSLAVDTFNKVHISYYDNTNGDLKYDTNASGSWMIENVDNSGNVGQYTSIAVGISGEVHMSYYDVTYGNLKYATNTSGSWEKIDIDSSSQNVSLYTSIGIDASGKIHISYYDKDNGNLNYATNASGLWTKKDISDFLVKEIDREGDVGLYTSLAVEPSGKIHISYYDTTNDDLKYATEASHSLIGLNVDKGKYIAEKVDYGEYVGMYSSIAVDISGKMHISYYDGTNSNLMYATNVTGSWVKSIVDYKEDVGWYTSIAVDKPGKVHISYYDWTNKILKYATNASGSWITKSVDKDEDTGLYTSLAVDTSNKAHISYYDRTNKDLKYATNVSGLWVTATVDSDGVVGMDTSIAVDVSNKVHISYYDVTNHDLKYATNASGLWKKNTVGTYGDLGRYNSIAVDTSGKVYISYYNRDDGDLVYATNVSGKWLKKRVDFNGNVGIDTSIAVDTSKNAHICYYDVDNSDLKYATNVSGSWVITTIDSSGNAGRYTSIALNPSNGVYISYYDITNGDLKCAWKASLASSIKSNENDVGIISEYDASVTQDISVKSPDSYDDTNNGLKHTGHAGYPPFHIHGHVFSESGNAIEGVRLSLKGEGYADIAESDANGCFTFEYADADTYRIIAEKDGYRKSIYEVKIPLEKDKEDDIIIQLLKSN